MNIGSLSSGSSPAISAKAGGKESLPAFKKSLDAEKGNAEGVMKMLDSASSVSGGGSNPGVGVMLDVSA
jgi:hypothetical protein